MLCTYLVGSMWLLLSAHLHRDSAQGWALQVLSLLIKGLIIGRHEIIQSEPECFDGNYMPRAKENGQLLSWLTGWMLASILTLDWSMENQFSHSFSRKFLSEWTMKQRMRGNKKETPRALLPVRFSSLVLFTWVFVVPTQSTVSLMAKAGKQGKPVLIHKSFIHEDTSCCISETFVF